MARNFAEIAFTDAVKALQDKYGSRKSYERMEKLNVLEGLSANEISFIAERDSFYMASIGSNGFPYIQHRGGPKGFLKVLSGKQLGFIDFQGNKQYITVGNTQTNSNVALIMVDYPNQARLKIYAKAEMVELKSDSKLYDLLNLNDYKFRPERMMILNIEAYDWNCPQHITPRYTIEELQDVLAEQTEYVSKLETQNKELLAQLNK